MFGGRKTYRRRGKKAQRGGRRKSHRVTKRGGKWDAITN